MGGMRNAYKISVGRLGGKRLHGRPRHRWKDNIKVDLKVYRLGRCGLDSTGSE
jgi:hypothetical protein